MKTFKEISEKAGAVAVPGAGLGYPYPKGSRHKDFTDKHVVQTTDHPVAGDNQFKGEGAPKKKKRLADYEYDKTQNKKSADIDQDSDDNEDRAAYEEVVIDDSMLEEDFIEITDEIGEAIADIYEALSEENKAAFDILLETDEGFERILEFVNGFEFISEESED
jgi:adenylosuccinate synthase